jgi:hypothetical protein
MALTSTAMSLPFYYRASAYDTASHLASGYEKKKLHPSIVYAIVVGCGEACITMYRIEEQLSVGIGENPIEYPFLLLLYVTD